MKTTLKRLALPPLLVLLLVGCNSKPGGAGAPGGMGAAGGPPPEVSVINVSCESLTLTTELPGRMDAVRMAEVRARVPGILLKRLFEEGADVKEGDVLLQIDPAPLRATYNSAKAALAKAEANLKQAQSKAERFKALVQYNAVSKQDSDDATATALQAEAEVMAAKAGLETASLNLGYASVTAPITGRIGRAKVTEGALVGQNEATPLATIQQLDPIYFDFTQSSTEVLKLRRALESGKLKSLAPGEAKVTLLLEDGTVYPHPGKLLFSDITVDPTTGMITLRALVPNPDHLLLPGMFARGQLEQAVDDQAITLPQRAVMRGPNGVATVMVVNSENKVEARVVQTEAAHGDKWVISGGLKPGERVMMEGHLKAPPGSVVTPVPFTTGQKGAVSTASSK
ncbi:MAG TPA: efflux RND transporter periplasmic adaptor subunit [Clostridia bacterium]|nr:efflux RND transporter periplasmic adaptor subunit [Clostridia bacterium]